MKVVFADSNKRARVFREGCGENAIFCGVLGLCPSVLNIWPNKISARDVDAAAAVDKADLLHVLSDLMEWLLLFDVNKMRIAIESISMGFGISFHIPQNGVASAPGVPGDHFRCLHDRMVCTLVELV